MLLAFLCECPLASELPLHHPWTYHAVTFSHQSLRGSTAPGGPQTVHPPTPHPTPFSSVSHLVTAVDSGLTSPASLRRSSTSSLQVFFLGVKCLSYYYKYQCSLFLRGILSPFLYFSSLSLNHKSQIRRLVLVIIQRGSDSGQTAITALCVLSSVYCPFSI